MSSPNPLWKPGDPVKSPVKDMVTINVTAANTAEIYKLMIGSIVPRPIAIVSTQSASGRGNLAPFSFFNGVSSDPPCLMISISRKSDGQKKDTWRNIEETGQFVVNTASNWLAEVVAHCGAEYPHGVNEAEIVGLTSLPSHMVKPPRIKESPVHFECELHKSLPIGDGGPGSTTLFIGRIVLVHVYDAAYANGKILWQKLRPIARLGGFSYTEVTSSFDLKIPEV